MNLFGPFGRARRELRGGRWVLWGFAAVLSAILIPVLILVAGIIAQVLNRGGLLESPLVLGRHLAVPLPDRFLLMTPIAQLSWLVALAALVCLMIALLMWISYRGLYHRSRQTIERLHRQILQRSLRRAEAEGVSAQRRRAEDLIEERLPQLQSGLSAWWRAIPRSPLLLIGCVTLALLVDIWLTLLAVVSGLLVWQAQRLLDGGEATEASQWELPRSRRRLVELVQQAPLLGRLQSGDVIGQAFEEELERIRRNQANVDRRRSRAIPLLTLATTAAVCVLVLALGVNLFGAPSGLSLPAALVLGLALVGAVAAATRLVHALNQVAATSAAAAAVYRFLEVADDDQSSERVGLSGLRDGVELNNVTLHDDAGRPVLSSLTLSLKPASLVAVLGTDGVSSAALVELLLGFGRPSKGRVLIDGLPIGEIHPRSLARQVFWVGHDGPLWNGTIAENLAGHEPVGGNEALTEATRAAGVYDRLQELEDGFSTIVAADDTRLDASLRYGVAVARALLRKPAVVIVQEPAAGPEGLTEDTCLTALRTMADNGSLVIVLPRRLRTLRMADRVVLLNANRFAGEGKHEALLQSSDLYRHLNYTLFNPYRHLSA